MKEGDKMSKNAKNAKNVKNVKAAIVMGILGGMSAAAFACGISSIYCTTTPTDLFGIGLLYAILFICSIYYYKKMDRNGDFCQEAVHE